MGSIKNMLTDLGLISDSTVHKFAQGTRDREDLTVMRDRNSGVIFIDDFVTAKETYETGEYRTIGASVYGKRDYEISVDVRRRVKDYEQFFVGKKILDFGCGEGTFLLDIQHRAAQVAGVEIENGYVNKLNDEGIKCFRNLSETTEKFDTIFCFHTLEHLSNPLEILCELREHLCDGGTLILEVPHANDFLLRYLNSEQFKKFTLWSQHLILHTRVSLNVILQAAGFKRIIIQGKQRYKVSNHLYWLSNEQPGGHKTELSAIDTDELTKSYESSLKMIDATDTLVAVISN